MHIIQFITLILLAGFVAAQSDGSKAITPHEQFSSSIGVLGCYMNTDRAAYLPFAPTCDGFCKKVSYQGRSVILAHVDTSGGYHDISYDAYNYLITGLSAEQQPITGGAVTMQMETVHPSNCASLFIGGKMAISWTGNAFPFSCPANSWVGQNYWLSNIMTSTCTYGIDEPCWRSAGDQITCASGRISNPTDILKGKPAYNRQVGTGQRYVAT